MHFRSLYDELYDEPNTDDDDDDDSMDNYEPLINCRSSEQLQETTFSERDLEDTADEPLIGDGIVLQISELDNISKYHQEENIEELTVGVEKNI